MMDLNEFTEPGKIKKLAAWMYTKLFENEKFYLPQYQQIPLTV